MSLQPGRHFQSPPALGLVSIPSIFLLTPPIADLARLVAQSPLLLQTISDPSDPYEIRWLAPHSASYFIVGLTWLSASCVAAERVAILASGRLWVMATLTYAPMFRRPAGAAVLASLCSFSHPT